MNSHLVWLAHKSWQNSRANSRFSTLIYTLILVWLGFKVYLWDVRNFHARGRVHEKRVKRRLLEQIFCDILYDKNILLMWKKKQIIFGLGAKTLILTAITHETNEGQS